MNDKTERLSMVFHPLRADECNLSVSSFSSSIEGLRKAVKKFDCDDLQIISLTTNSPVAMTVEGAPPLSQFYGGLKDFASSGKIPATWNREKIDAVLDFLNPVGKTVGALDVKSGDDSITLNTQYRIEFEKSIEDDFYTVGTVDGTLEAINIHGKTNSLTIYPVIGKKRIICDFDKSFLDKIKNLIGLYVEISGEMRYRWRDKFPYKGIVSQIEAIEEDYLPTFADLYGIAPDATRSEPSEDFIARIRREWQQ